MHFNSLQIIRSNKNHPKIVAAVISVTISLILFAIKIYAYHLTGSKAVFSDALESIVNIVAGFFSVYVVMVSLMPADEDHPYGHGKIELLGAGFEGGAIFFAAVLIVVEAVQGLLRGSQIRQLDLGLALVLFAGAINGLLGYYLYKTGKKNHSSALIASGHHILSDFYTSLGIIIGLGIVKLSGILWLDPVCAILVALHLGYTGMKLVLHSGSELMDASDNVIIERLAQLFNKHAFPGIIRIHHTRVMRSGNLHHVDLHMVVPEFWEIAKAHEQSSIFENLVIEDYPFSGELHFHLDPCSQTYCKICELGDCPIRKETFIKKIPFSLEELISPIEREINLS